MNSNRRRPRPTNAGFTLVELLLSIALAAIITAFVSNGLKFGIRAWESNAKTQNVLDAGVLETAISKWVSGAIMVKRDTKARDSEVLFAGGPEGLRFISLSNGRTQRSGLLEVAIATVPGKLAGTTDLSIAKRIFRRDGAVIDGAGQSRKANTAIEFSYFGVPPGGRAPRWSMTWEGSDHLPLLVAFRLKEPDEPVRPEVIAKIGDGEILVQGSAP